MAKIDLTPDQERELKSKGFLAKPVTDVVSNRRCYWDPRKDEKGRVFGWTRPLPGDTARLNFYLRKGFRMEDPDGNMAPPPGYFRKRLEPTPIPTQKKVQEVSIGSGEIAKTEGLQCPICNAIYPDTDTLVHHMIYHRSAKAKAESKLKPRKPKRGKSQKSNKEVN